MMNRVGYRMNYEIFQLTQCQDQLTDELIYRVFMSQYWFKINREEF